MLTRVQILNVASLSVAAGIRLKSLVFGKTLGAGAFGTVKQATVQLNGQAVPVAVKTLTFTSSRDFEDHLKEFKTEATVGWELGARSRENVIPAPRYSTTLPHDLLIYACRWTLASARLLGWRTTQAKHEFVCTCCWSMWSVTAICTILSMAQRTGSAFIAARKRLGRRVSLSMAHPGQRMMHGPL